MEKIDAIDMDMIGELFAELNMLQKYADESQEICDFVRAQKWGNRLVNNRMAEKARKTMMIYVEIQKMKQKSLAL